MALLRRSPGPRLRVARLTADELPALIDPCAACVRWQLDAVTREARCGQEYDEKLAWVSRVLREWGSCGRVLYDEDRIVGHVLYAPAVFVPGAEAFPTSPVGPDAVVLAGLRVDPAYAGRGAGRRLVQAMAKDLILRGDVRAVEAFAGYGECLLPVGFLLGVGFRTVRAHPRTPRLRMDLRSFATWRAEWEVAVDRLRAALPVPGPAPASRAPRGAAGVRLSRLRRGAAAR